ncbi:class I adenylate-forming enzyme family protein [Streptomyces sp. BH105]|uniref:class I adenylate-forming enzyme family protein n=1 Tax=Streptomyces sp. BH105 TaxID=3410408 RepID=UPI003CFBB3D7
MEHGTGITQLIRKQAASCTGAEVLRHVAADGSESKFTWWELDRRSDQLAGALAGRRLDTGDRLSLALRNTPQLIFGVFAAWKLGAVPVPVRWDLPEWELDRLRKVVRAPVHLGAEDVPWIDATVTAHVPTLPYDVMSPYAHGICSSGSTGTPKVILTARPALHAPAFSTPLMESWAPVPRPQTILVLAPMYHANGFTTLFGLFDGDRLVVMEKFDAARVVDVIERHRVTTFTATPTMLQRIADLPGIDDRDLSSLEWILQGAAPMPPALVHRWAGLIGPERIVMAYGMTEGLGITALRADEWMTHQGSVGRPLRATELRILDPDGKEVPVGETGDIYLRSPRYHGYEYLGDTPSLKTTPDGFQTAGDVGRVDADGYLYLLDRRVDIIISGGANVFPAEVEAALIDHPAIADVVVIGLRDPEWGRRVHALIEPSDPAAPPTHDEVVAYARGRLAAYKLPKTTEFVEVMPRSAATKVNRGALVAARGG